MTFARSIREKPDYAELCIQRDKCHANCEFEPEMALDLDNVKAIFSDAYGKEPYISIDLSA